jgi:HAD superfamily hydrolase (TIGR01509 family)
MDFKVVLFDVDGVLSLHGQSFSTIYAKERNIDYKNFRNFFQGDFQEALVGKADLKKLIADHEDLWQTDGDIDNLMSRWFEFEDKRNKPLLKIVESLRAKGIKCYLVTNQENYRGKHIVNNMFKGEFDGYFVSADIGSMKPSREFFLSVVDRVKSENPGIATKDILFIDDSPEHIEGAALIGINAYLYENLEQIKTLLTGKAD